MKGLKQFIDFNWDKFACDKQFVVTGVSEYTDFDSGAHLGTKVECVISVDNTQYAFKDGEKFTNRFQSITFKVAKDVNVPLDAKVMPKSVTAKVYGEYQNQLSVKCEDIAVAVPVSVSKERS